MTCPLEEMTRLLAGLSVGMPSKQTLESIRVILTSVTPSELKDYAPKIDIARIFTCFSTSDSEQIALASDILAHLLKYLSHEYILTRYEDLLLEGLSHMDKTVQEFILELLVSAASQDDTASLLATKLELLLHCVRLVGSEDVGSKATKMLVTLAKRSFVMAPPLIEEMRATMQKSETIRFRIYDIFVTFASTSPENLAVSEESQILQSLVDEVSSGDILILLNGVELLKTLAVSSHGRNYLEKQGTVQKLAEGFTHLIDDPMSGLIVPGMIKFFGVLCHYDSGIIERHSSVVDAIFDLIEDGDASLRTLAIETFSFIASNEQAKLVLSHNGVKCEKAMRSIASWISQGNTEYRIKVLNSISELVNSPIEESRLLEVNERWFSQLGSSAIRNLTNVAKQPVKELRYAALGVFLNLSRQLWAQRLMSKQAGFLEFLLDRRAEPDKDCIECKFHIVKSLAQVPENELVNIWGQYAVSQIHEHLREGPWFARAQANVAFESQD